MFIIVGSREKDDVYALKRVSWPSNSGGLGGRGGRGGGRGRGGAMDRGGRTVSTSVSLDLPPGLDNTDVTVWCISDGYVGVETTLGVRLQNSMEVPGSWIEKDHDQAPSGGDAPATVPAPAPVPAPTPAFVEFPEGGSWADELNDLM